MRRENVGLLPWCGYQVRNIRLPFELGPNVKVYKAHEGTLWDYAAWAAYGDEELWYILADANGITDPFIPLKSGEKIVIPRQP